MKAADFVRKKLKTRDEFVLFPHQFKQNGIFNLMESYAEYVLKKAKDVKEINIAKGQYPLIRGIFKKNIEAEMYVDEYTKRFGKPPTYQEVADKFNLKSKGAAYARLRHCRQKMIRYKAQPLKETV